VTPVAAVGSVDSGCVSTCNTQARQGNLRWVFVVQRFETTTRSRNLFTREGTPVTIEQEVGFAPEPVWTFLEKRRIPYPVGIRTLERPVRILVALPATFG
jgi:hypothetical protein